MSQDLYDAGAKRCYTCIQWEGQRTFYRETKKMKVDIGREGNCLVHRKKVKGSHYCEQYFALK